MFSYPPRVEMARIWMAPACCTGLSTGCRSLSNRLSARRHLCLEIAPGGALAAGGFRPPAIASPWPWRGARVRFGHQEADGASVPGLAPSGTSRYRRVLGAAATASSTYAPAVPLTVDPHREAVPVAFVDLDAVVTLDVLDGDVFASSPADFAGEGTEIGPPAGILAIVNPAGRVFRYEADGVPGLAAIPQPVAAASIS